MPGKWGLGLYFNYIVVVSFIGGENWSTRRKPSTSHWQTLSHNVVSSTHYLSGIRTSYKAHAVLFIYTENSGKSLGSNGGKKTCT